MSQEGNDHRINFFYVYPSNNDDSDNHDMDYRLEEEYKESLYNDYNESDRQCSYHDLYANRYNNVTNSITNDNHQYNIKNDNTYHNNDYNSNNNNNNYNDNNYSNNDNNFDFSEK